jgi:hypothetical protein
MIYQCYFKEDQKEKLFINNPYKEFGLEPEVNNTLFLNCPELEDKNIRLQLTEYACFLWHWRNPSDNPDSWFGTTSYRQLDKTKFKFNNSKLMEKYLNKDNIISWGVYAMRNKYGNPISLAKHTDVCHPNLVKTLNAGLNHFNYKIPDAFFITDVGIFANYWVLQKEEFYKFMNFSWPIVKWAFNNIHNYEYFTKEMPGNTVTKNKSVGYFMERLFVCWYLMTEKKILSVSEPMPLYHNA